MPLITLMTDFGLKDGNVAVMKGIINNISPSTQITDITHLVQPQNIKEAALILSRAAPFFPKNTIHVIVVDPGVGTVRRAIAAKIGMQYYICPDNGVLTLVINEAIQANLRIKYFHLDNPRYWLPSISHVFHGRDIFAPVAAHLSKGVNIKKLGTALNTIEQIDFPHPKKHGKVWKGEIIYIDAFGNIVTNISSNHLQSPKKCKVKLCKIVIKNWVKTFGDELPGELVALYSSIDYLIISKVNGNAAKKLNAKIGDPVEVEYS